MTNSYLYCSCVDSQGGSISVCGETLAGDDIMVKRGFRGDETMFEAAVSEDGKVMVILDTRQDEKVMLSVQHFFYFSDINDVSLTIPASHL